MKCIRVSSQQILTTGMAYIVVNTSTDNAEPHAICSTSNKMFLRTEKGIAWHIDASCIVWTLNDNGKLVHQIAKLVAIVVRIAGLRHVMTFIVHISHHNGDGEIELKSEGTLCDAYRMWHGSCIN